MADPKDINTENQIQFTRAKVNTNTFNKDNGTFDITFATETPVLRSGWDENYNEVLNCDSSNIRMERMDNGLPLLNAHPDNSGRVMPTDVMGKISNCRCIDRSLVGTVTLGANATPEIRSDIENGILDTFSVGYNVYKGIREDMGKDATPTYRMTDWEPNHVAIAPIPADYKSKIRSLINNLNNNNMAEPVTPVSPVATPVAEPTPAATTAVDLNAERALIQASEKARFDSILLSARSAKISDTKTLEFIQSGKTVEEVRQLIIEEFVKGDPKPVNVSVGKEAGEKKRTGIEAALLHRINPSAFKDEKDIGGEFRGMTLMEMGKELLIEGGINVRGLTKNEIAKEVFTARRDMSTSDFPLLLEGLANKALRADYGYAEEYWNLIARETSVNDFKAKNLYQVESVNGMQETPEGDEIKYAKLLEAKQTIKVKSFAEGLLFTRQAFINDDLSAFEKIPSKFVLDWATLQGDLVWGMITNNVKMDDTKGLFHADHNNLAGTAGILSDTSLETALIAFKNQKAIDGKRKIRVQPKYLIVSSSYEITARKLLAMVAPTQVANVNVFSSMGIVLIVEPRLSGKAWYLTSDPNAIDGLYYAYLDGNGGLRSSRIEDFDTDSIKFAVRGEFGVAAIDYRGWYKNAGE